jgi:hypothetical protein
MHPATGGHTRRMSVIPSAPVGGAPCGSRCTNSTNRGKRVPTSSGNKRGDLEIKRLNVAGTSDIITDVAVVHEFRGGVAQDERHGQPRHPNPDKVLIDKAVTKVQGNAYGQDYLHNHNNLNAFMPLSMSTSDRLPSSLTPRCLLVLCVRDVVNLSVVLFCLGIVLSSQPCRIFSK